LAGSRQAFCRRRLRRVESSSAGGGMEGTACSGLAPGRVLPSCQSLPSMCLSCVLGTAGAAAAGTSPVERSAAEWRVPRGLSSAASHDGYVVGWQPHGQGHTLNDDAKDEDKYVWFGSGGHAKAITRERGMADSDAGRGLLFCKWLWQPWHTAAADLPGTHKWLHQAMTLGQPVHTHD